MTETKVDELIEKLRPVVIRLQPGDILWLSSPIPIHPAALGHIVESLKPLLPEGCRVCIGEQGLTPAGIIRGEPIA